MMKKAVAGILLAAALAGCAQQSGPGAEAARARHKNFEQLGGAFKKLSEELKKPAPDAALLSARAGEIATLAEALPTWFPAGSGPQDGVKTDALEAVWTKPDEFTTKAEAFKTAALVLRDAGSDAALMAPLAGKLGAACKSCHENFRKK